MKKSLYILQDGELHRKDNSLYFESEIGRKFIPVENTNDIFIFGDIKVSKRFLDFCSQKHILLHYFDNTGLYAGTYYPREQYNSGHSIIKQVECFLNQERVYVLAGAIAEGYINQCLRVVSYYESRKTGTIKEDLAKIEELINNKKRTLDMINAIDELRLVVHDVEFEYNKSLKYILNNTDFIDDGDKNSINLQRKKSIFQFAESVGFAIVLSEIFNTYLDPRIGYLHETNKDKFSLCLDVFYIFKPIMVHRLIFSLINKSIITRGDYNNYKDKVILNIKAKGKFINELDKRMRNTIKHRHLNRQVSYKRLIRLELYKIQKYIVEDKEYKAYQTLW